MRFGRARRARRAGRRRLPRHVRRRRELELSSTSPRGTRPRTRSPRSPPRDALGLPFPAARSRSSSRAGAARRRRSPAAACSSTTATTRTRSRCEPRWSTSPTARAAGARSPCSATWPSWAPTAADYHREVGGWLRELGFDVAGRRRPARTRLRRRRAEGCRSGAGPRRRGGSGEIDPVAARRLRARQGLAGDRARVGRRGARGGQALAVVVRVLIAGILR